MSFFECGRLFDSSFDRHRYNSLEIPIGVRLAKRSDMGDLALVPEIRAVWIYMDIYLKRNSIYTRRLRSP